MTDYKLVRPGSAFSCSAARQTCRDPGQLVRLRKNLSRRKSQTRPAQGLRAGFRQAEMLTADRGPIVTRVVRALLNAPAECFAFFKTKAAIGVREIEQEKLSPQLERQRSLPVSIPKGR